MPVNKLKFKLKNTQNPHLKIIEDTDIDMLNTILNEILKHKKKVSILNIGGGYTKKAEQFLKNHTKTIYYTLDLQNTENQKHVIVGDITDKKLELGQTFDFIYTADTFEHILNPWDATKNIKKILNSNGYILCKAPFSWRYHACPFDTSRRKSYNNI